MSRIVWILILGLTVGMVGFPLQLAGAEPHGGADGQPGASPQPRGTEGSPSEVLNQDLAAATRPLPRAHAHNDYEHSRPLFDALDQGFCSVEADVHLINDDLWVAHDASEVRPGRTFRSLYLEPLAERVRLHQGRVYPGGPEFTLMVDIKGDAEATYQVLSRQLREYTPILTRFEAAQIHTNGVRVILSGNRPRAKMLAEEVRYAAYDGRLSDLSRDWPAAFMPWISDNWGQHFQWRGVGPLPAADRDRLRQLVSQVHAQNRRLRFWAVPDQPEAWNELYQAGVDLINTDNLAGLRRFFDAGKPPTSATR